ncbi:hypothetical protein [Priestia endophytica]|nr:hypothetical protein [Priestia endophytica]
MTSILVMGGSVFISKALATHLIEQGYNVDLFTREKKSINYSGFNSYLV